MPSALDHVADLGAFVEASPSSHHAAAEGARRLEAAGFAVQQESAEWSSEPGGHYLIRDGALIAWRIPDSPRSFMPFRILGSHTDSTGFTLKPKADTGGYGWQQVGVEIYGAPLLNSWLDRELGLAGRLVLRDGTTTLVRTEAIMRIPQLAIHLDRSVNDEGLKLDKQAHTAPVWSVGHPGIHVLDHLAEAAGCPVGDIDGYDLRAYDTASPAIFGPHQEFFATGRLDNLSSLHASIVAVINADDADAIHMVAAFDHEELGSASRSGASGPLLADVLTRVLAGLGATLDQRHRSLAQSFCLSADTGHAIHPNYPGRHDPVNQPLLNSGPLLKINANQRYATDGRGAALWRRICRAADIPTQMFVSNNAVPCGSTIGPLTATRLGIATVDVGIPMLSMHSARELAGTEDPLTLTRAMEAFLACAEMSGRTS
jgi:aspartyl aminopeptidase